ncbi:MAG: undecaprenyl-diphosphate phosphatase [Bacteroidota bacterium]
MSIIQAILLAIVEGLTEFLPVSSTGHLIIVSSLMGIASDPFTKTFTVAVQLGAILSVIVLYWNRFFQSLKFYYKLALAFIPAGLFGFILNDRIDNLLERVDIVAYTLIIGGVIFLFIDRLFKDTEENGNLEVSYPIALKIGLFQTIALIPGVSRSAATIIGGLTQKLNKKAAAEFSFFLAVPTMFAATAYKLLRFYKEGNNFGAQQLTLLAIGNVVAFVIAIFAIKSFIGFLTRHGFKVFGYYRIALGILILILYFAGIQLSIV